VAASLSPTSTMIAYRESSGSAASVCVMSLRL
jgi:hypothetical protein